MITLVLPDTITREIDAATRLPVETAGVLIASRLEQSSNGARLLGRALHWVPEEAYTVRKSDRLSIASQGYVAALGEAERLGGVALWFHTHPGEGALPIPSHHDHQVDRDISDLFRLRTDSAYYGTLIASPLARGFSFTGTLQHEGGALGAITRLWSVGDAWNLTHAINSDRLQLSPIFDRNIRALGPDIQSTLGDLTVGVVGCGGTGSAVAEQLVRLGIRHLVLIDVDELSASNVTRVYGSTPLDIGRPKVEIARAHLTGIAPDLDCRSIVSMVTLEDTARNLTGCDLVFGCTDDNAGRLVLSRLSSYLLTPVIDVGVLLSSDSGGTLTGIDGRVTILSPGSACLVCRNRIDLARAAVELRTPEERKRLEDEGYAPALAGVEPAVVTFTTAVAAAAVSELLERLIGYGASPRPSEILLRLHEREISTNAALPRPGHYCDFKSEKWGAANLKPFLEQVWPSS